MITIRLILRAFAQQAAARAKAKPSSYTSIFHTESGLRYNKPGEFGYPHRSAKWN